MCYQSSCHPGVENLMRTRWYISRAPTPVVEQDVARVGEPQGTMKQCLCSPTTHPGGSTVQGPTKTGPDRGPRWSKMPDRGPDGNGTVRLEATVIATPAIVLEIAPETPPSPDYVPASHGYVPESNLEESPE
uniref:Uncharacterized protein n=1 Tax=Tanacetum cinerariifolium TaxID=118510 RepID=A0A6L2MZD9_TANCI|nr:hypothetical protein [Tanacetum cinerariifolium]